MLVVDREQEAGGIPRHSAHTGYGIRDLHRLMTGPAYARHYRRAASSAGVMVRTGTTLVGWPAAGRATLTSQAGIEDVNADAVLLATGCRERPRPARLVPGSRPAGVLTTGELQQRVFLHGQRLTGRAVVVGAEHVSFSAMLTLLHAGARVTALVTEQPRHQSFAAFQLAARLRWRVPVWTRTTVTGIAGRDEVSVVMLRDERDGSVRTVPCELVVFSGDWIPDHELARLAGADLDPGTRGPAVDTALSTSVPGMFAARQPRSRGRDSGRGGAQWPARCGPDRCLPGGRRPRWPTTPRSLQGRRAVAVDLPECRQPGQPEAAAREVRAALRCVRRPSAA